MCQIEIVSNNAVSVGNRNLGLVTEDVFEGLSVFAARFDSSHTAGFPLHWKRWENLNKIKWSGKSELFCFSKKSGKVRNFSLSGHFHEIKKYYFHLKNVVIIISCSR